MLLFVCVLVFWGVAGNSSFTSALAPNLYVFVSPSYTEGHPCLEREESQIDYDKNTPAKDIDTPRYR